MDEVNAEAVEYPHAKIVGVQFGLLSNRDIMKLSVFQKNGEPDIAAKKRLTDSRLGLPNSENECKSCGESLSHKCEGHFGHLTFPCPVYHPNYVSVIAKILDSLCLRCLSIKKIKKKRPVYRETFDYMHDGDARMDLDDKTAIFRGDMDITKESRLGSIPKVCSFSMPPGIKEEPQELSSIGVSYCAETSRSCKTASSHRAEERAFKEKSCQETHVPVVIDLISDDDDDYNEAPHGGKMPSVAGTSKQCLPTQITTDSVSKHSGKKMKSPCRDKFKDDDKKGLPSRHNTGCKYCKNGEYPKLHVKVEQVVQSNKSVVQKIFLHYMDAYGDDDDVDFPDDYLKLLNKRPEDFDSGKLPLLPSEVLMETFLNI